jgi:hypothetical protein
MKKLFLVCIALSFVCLQPIQSQEFTTYDNGLIYNKSTMSKLAHIVDSLNLQYKYCDLNKTYYGKKQAIGHMVQLGKGAVIEAKKDIENGISFDAFVKKYPSAKTRKNELIISKTYTRNDTVTSINFSRVNLDNKHSFGLHFSENTAHYTSAKAGTWLYNYDKKYQTLRAIYFKTKLEAPTLAEKYARMVGYADCLIDTTTTKLKKNTTVRYFDHVSKDLQKLSQREKENLLDSLRGIRVAGRCSMDTSPRFHAVNIALLAAETVNWEIFLRSHLDIMNDRFDRASDASYAQAGRKTYIKELETLNINISDLIFGISLRVENPAKNHYYGTTYRIGRALAESKYKTAIEAQFASMMKDAALDDYNKVIVYFLYRNYIQYLEDKTEKAKSIDRLNLAITTLPDYLKTKIAFVGKG